MVRGVSRRGEHVSEIAQFGLETVDAISHLVKANRYLQALVVLYSAIDTLAWATCSGGDVTRSDFCCWVSTYMSPQDRLRCAPEDLYAARCGLLHSGAAESKLSRNGKASELWYATSPRSVPALEGLANRVGAKVLYVTALVASFSDGVMEFAEELAGDEARQREVTERIRRWIRFIPSASVREGATAE